MEDAINERRSTHTAFGIADTSNKQFGVPVSGSHDSHHQVSVTCSTVISDNEVAGFTGNRDETRIQETLVDDKTGVGFAVLHISQEGKARARDLFGMNPVAASTPEVVDYPEHSLSREKDMPVPSENKASEDAPVEARQQKEIERKQARREKARLDAKRQKAEAEAKKLKQQILAEDRVPLDHSLRVENAEWLKAQQASELAAGGLYVKQRFPPMRNKAYFKGFQLH